MNTPTEQQLREVFAADSAAAPQGVDLMPGALQKVRQRRRVRMAGAAGLIGAVVVVGATVASGGGQAHQPTRPPGAASSHPAGRAVLPGAGSVSAPTGVGAIRSDTVADCVQAYSPVAIAGRSFAFDGTVTAIGPARSNGSGAPLPVAGVTFWVHTWFRGGSGETVTVDLEQPRAGNADSAVDAYGVGTRLLVSGEPRWGGTPLQGAIAWGCGFTRYYDPQTAAEWAAATH